MLDNWYWLHKDLTVFDVDTSPEVILYLLSTIAYSCLPYLYGVRSGIGAPAFTPPDWLALNLLLICMLDAVRKSATLVKMRGQYAKYAAAGRQHIAGAYLFFVVSGAFYSAFLAGFLWASASSTSSVEARSLAVVILWALIRTADIVVIPRISSLMSKILLSGLSPEKAPASGVARKADSENGS